MHMGTTEQQKSHISSSVLSREVLTSKLVRESQRKEISILAIKPSRRGNRICTEENKSTTLKIGSFIISQQ